MLRRTCRGLTRVLFYLHARLRVRSCTGIPCAHSSRGRQRCITRAQSVPRECRIVSRCHAPSPDRREAPSDDRLQRGIPHSRGLSAEATASLECWIARSSRAMTTSELFDMRIWIEPHTYAVRRLFTRKGKGRRSGFAGHASLFGLAWLCHV